ncbi:hypothetical protein [Rubrobacter radiotolerans]|uniref:DUF4398 domain-containing protein n=2 Tax=Rubrobacter radiotolerans TaxID=42256 RepID=A0AB35T0Z3_RUBRA|nr:hypothetical protein [Rubrobacter radiotolerans]MDX5893242.1 hypothetical protein [Rubrobacter radiotolerans]
MEDAILSLLMVSMINLGVIRITAAAALLALTAVLAGCSSLSEAREEASEAFGEANASIDRHNDLFAQARETYNSVKTNIEAGEAPDEQREDIVRARENLAEARGHLQTAREDLARVPELTVDEPVREYAGHFIEAIDLQIAAEGREIEFYRLLEGDPALDRSRDEALDLLAEVGDGYARAEDAYRRAQDLANENPDVIGPATGQDAPETA